MKELAVFQGQKSRTDDDRNSRLYRVLKIICRFSYPEDLYGLQRTDFLRLCEVSQIHWNLEGPLFKNNSILMNRRESTESADGSSAGTDLFPDRGGDFQKIHPLDYVPSTHRFKKDLTCKGRGYGRLIFISSEKMSRKQKIFLNRVSEMISSSLYFMEDTRQLEISKDQWDMVFDAFYGALCITDEQFHILRTNRAFRQLTGRKKTETAGQNVFSAFPIPVEPYFPLREEETWVSDSPSGSPPLNLEFSMKTILLKNERLRVRLFLVKDITEEIKMERKISSQAQFRELGLIKSSMAHELNNPIAGIKALLTVIESGLAGAGVEKHFLEDMHSAVNRCQEIVSRLLTAVSSTPSSEEAANK